MLNISAPSFPICVAKIIRARFDSLFIKMATVPQVCRVMVDLDSTMKKQKHCVVLAPTFRSDFDVIVMKYLSFCLAGLGLDIPSVFAGEDVKDSTIGAKLGKTKASYDQHAILCPFLEGAPSSDGRLQQPRTEFLTALANSPGNHDYTVIPLCIDYDRIDNNAVPAHGTDLGLWGMFSLYWKVCVLGKAQESLGGIRVAFGVPKALQDASEAGTMCTYIHNEHKRLTGLSAHHIAAADKHLKIPPSTLSAAGEQLGVSFWGNADAKTEKKKRIVVETAEESLYLHMQWIYRFAPYLCDSHPEWAKWIMNSSMIDKQPNTTAVIDKTKEIEAVVTKLCAAFDNADALAKRVVAGKDISSLAVHDIVKEMKSLDTKPEAGSAAFYAVAANFVTTTKA